jgi:hypothetical protein
MVVLLSKEFVTFTVKTSNQTTTKRLNDQLIAAIANDVSCCID